MPYNRTSVTELKRKHSFTLTIREGDFSASFGIRTGRTDFQYVGSSQQTGRHIIEQRATGRQCVVDTAKLITLYER